MTLNRTTLTALAWIGAVAAVLVAMFAPLPRAVLSEEELAAGRMPETRQQVEQARNAFDQAEAGYRTYVSSHDVGAALNAFESVIAEFGGNADSTEGRAALQSAAAPLLVYLEQLEAYARGGEQYFSALRHYDDELMAWTRSLGQESEALRSATWPIVEYLKLYPPPTGQKDGYTSVSASQVLSHSIALAADLQRAAAPTLQTDVQAVRETGRSVEYIESLHPQYEKLLRDYDGNLQSLIAAQASAEPDARRTLATVLDVAVAVLLGVGIVGLLLPLTKPGVARA
jgi:hypothetical protein